MTVLDLGERLGVRLLAGPRQAVTAAARSRSRGAGARGSTATAWAPTAPPRHFGGAAGIIRPAELAVGKIDHALFMVVKCTNGESVPPAGSGAGTACSDIGLPNEGAPPMGAHFFLDMTDAEIAAAAGSDLEEDDHARRCAATASSSATPAAASSSSSRERPTPASA